MNFSDIFKNGLSYPTKNWTNLIILGIVFVAMTLIGTASAYTDHRIILAIAGIISFILAIILQGYKLEVIAEGVKGGSNIPLLSFDNLINGIKSILVSIVYYIIPAIIVMIVGTLSGLYSNLAVLIQSIVTKLAQSATVDASVINATISAIPPDVISKTFNSLIITGIIAVILFIIFGIFELVAQGKLAETGNLSEAVSIGNVVSKVGSIGWLRIIGFLIVMICICAILIFVSGLISAIPFIGSIIAALIISPFMFLFEYYSIGLLYASDK